MRIGYFAPEFPGQTHIFHWRECQALQELGIEIGLVSTRRPPAAIISHTWSQEAQEKTTYLFPFSLGDGFAAVWEILKAGPQAWFRCFKAILEAKGLSGQQRLRLLLLSLMAGKLVRLAKAQGWIHIHVSSCADAANVAMFASLLSGIPYSLHLLGPTLEGYGPNQEQKWQHAAFGLTVSELLLKVLQERLAGFLPPDVVVAAVGVNLDKIKRRSPYVPWRGEGPCRLYSCGRLNRVKGYNYLIETVRLLRQRGLDIRLQIAGEDEQGGKGYRQEVERLIQESGISEYVEMLGAVSEERNQQGYEEAHLFVLASLNEGISVAIMEAMAMETPAIVTNVGGNSELIDNGVDAIMVQPEQPEEMAAEIMKVLENPDLAMQLSQRSREKVATKFHHRYSAEAIFKLLQKTSASRQKIENSSKAHSRH